MAKSRHNRPLSDHTIKLRGSKIKYRRQAKQRLAEPSGTEIPSPYGKGHVHQLATGTED